MAAELSFLYSFPPDKSAQELSPVEYDSQMRTFLQRLNSIPAGIWAKGEIDKQDILEVNIQHHLQGWVSYGLTAMLTRLRRFSIQR